jgi:hypothetical protein
VSCKTQVAEANADHDCWERPEDMDTPRTAYKVDANNPGSDVAAETAAAFAAASMAFRHVDTDYSDKLLRTARRVSDPCHALQNMHFRNRDSYMHFITEINLLHAHNENDWIGRFSILLTSTEASTVTASLKLSAPSTAPTLATT